MHKGKFVEWKREPSKKRKKHMERPCDMQDTDGKFFKARTGREQGERLKIRLEKQAGTTPHRALWTR